MTCHKRLRVAQYASALMVVPCSMNATRRTTFRSQKNVVGLLIFTFILSIDKSHSNGAVDMKLPWNKANGRLRSSELQSMRNVDMLERYAQMVFTFWMTFIYKESLVMDMQFNIVVKCVDAVAALCMWLI
jgi:uncharacterized membrane protein